MPVVDIACENGIFTCKELGRIDEKDAKQFEASLSTCAAASPTPLVVLIDAREAEYITPEANRVFVQSSSIPNVKINIVVTTGLIMTQSSQILVMRGRRRNTQIFENWDDAYFFAQGQVESINTVLL